MVDKIELWKEKNSKYIIFIYFILLIFIAFGLNNLFADSRDMGYISTNPISHDFKMIWYSFITLCFGAFYGITLIVAWFDWTKRLQSILILVSSFIVITAYLHILTLRPLIFIIGLSVGAFISHITRTKKGNYVEYKVSTIIIAVIASIIVWLTLLNYIAGNSKADISFMYLLLASAFSVVFYKFATYPVISCKLFMIGPMRAGKTVFVCALYEQARQQNRVIDIPSSYLRKDYRLLSDGYWPPATVDEKPCNFSYIHGNLFTKKMIIDIDYSGDLLVHHIKTITDYLDDKRVNNNIQPKDKIENIAEGIYNADKLIFLIDPVRTGSNDELGNYIEEYYMKILEKIPGKLYYLVVTKSDKLFDSGRLPIGNYEQLRKDAIHKLEMMDSSFRVMKDGAEAVLPVLFFENEKKPEITKGKFKIFGFDKVLEVVGR